MTDGHLKRAFYLVLGCVFFIMGIYSASGVNAQGQTQLSIQPAAASVVEGSTTTVTVEVIDGLDLSAYDLTIIYDSEVVTLESWSQGTYLSNLAVVKQESQPGRFRLAATQIASPGVSGNGTLLTLVFGGSALGGSIISIQEAELVTSTGDMVIPALTDGVIEVISAPAPTFTTTHTPTPTRTFTPTYTATATRVRTSTPTRTPPATFTSTLSVTPMVTTPPLATQKTPLPNGTPEMTSTRQPTVQLGSLAQPGKTTTQTSFTQVLGTAQSKSTNEPEPGNNKADQMAQFNILLWSAVVLLMVLLAGMIIYRVIQKRKENSIWKG